MNLIQELSELKSKIEDAKTKSANISGKIESLHEELEKEFECKNTEDAELLLQKLETENKKESIELEKEIEMLQKEFRE
jgi:septation ring formation regulator EzrA